MARDGSTTVRILRIAPWARNPLMRLSDRVEGLVGILAVLSMLAAVPVAIWCGAAGHHAAAARIRSENSTKSAVAAVITTAPDRPSASEVATNLWHAHARWERPGGSAEAVIDVLGTTKPGDRITLWLGPDGHPTTPPLSADVAVAQGTGIGFLSAAGMWIGTSGFTWFTGRLLARRRAAEWDREWRRISPAIGQDKQ
ncbi:hypothetical protein [Nocardia sp. NPDC051570]|uniref:Rv1733c family protein n=1 Tax=Nocardia sp. NPDC051570 TaxID=3364324 RepID=UPI00379C3279